MSLKAVIKYLCSDDIIKIEQALTTLTRRTKTYEEVSELYDHGGFDKVYKLLKKEEERFTELVLSILANCANLHQNWRTAFYKQEGIACLVDILQNSSNVNVLCRTARLLANLSKDTICLNAMQEKFIICSLVKHGVIENVRCQLSCLRALRIICSNKKSAKLAAENNQFLQLLNLLNSSEKEVVLLCFRMLCELLKTQAVEVCYRAIESDTLSKILLCSQDGEQDVKDICLEILFLLTLNSGCRVTVAVEGAIHIFVNRIKTADQSETFKYATQGLCLCAREAVSRNKMKTDGVLPALVDVLHQTDLVRYHEAIVAAFVWFLFDDSSLGLLIRADVIPGLLKYLDRLTAIEFTRNTETVNDEILNSDDMNETTVNSDVAEPQCEDLKEAAPLTTASVINLNNPFREQYPQYQYSSPETSPYYANSPQYSIPSFSPHMSPGYSPPASPGSAAPMLDYDSYSDATVESSCSSTSYHFQSADGAHAMIHGTRGPVNDTLLLLSRFSQADDPSSFFLYLPGFNSLIDYLLLSDRPNPKCARILNRLTLNSHCFDVMIKKRLTTRLYLRLCTGWSLEHLTKLLEQARHKWALRLTDESLSSPELEQIDTDEQENLYKQKQPSAVALSLGQLLVSNVRSQSESSYGKGVLSHILLTGSKALKETCAISLPHIIWSARSQKRIFSDLKALKILMGMLLTAIDRDSETFVLIVEAVCALCRLVGLTVDKPDHVDTIIASTNKVEDTNTTETSVQLPRKRKSLNEAPAKPLLKHRKMDAASTLCEQTICLKLPSGNILQCDPCVLSKHSTVFDCMLSQQFVDSKKAFISITDVNEDAFKTLVHFMFGCKIHLGGYLNCLCVENSSHAVIETPLIECNKGSIGMDQVAHKKEIIDTDNRLTNDSKYSCSSKVDQLCSDNNISETCRVSNIECNSSQTRTCRTSCIDVGSVQDAASAKNEYVNWVFASHLLKCSERFFVDELKEKCEIYLTSILSEDNVIDLLLFSLWHHSPLLLRYSLVYLLTTVKCPMKRTKYLAEVLHSQHKDIFVSRVEEIIQNALRQK